MRKIYIIISLIAAIIVSISYYFMTENQMVSIIPFKVDKTINYIPNVFVEKIPRVVEESSGMLFWRGFFLTINDSGGKPYIYGLDTAKAKVRFIIKINAENIDWEDLAQDKDYFYIGDFGNNWGIRQDLRILKIKKDSSYYLSKKTTVEPAIIQFRFREQKSYRYRNKRHSFDCEAMLCFGDSIYLFTKDWLGNNTRVYKLPKIPGNYLINSVSSFNVDGLITGADYNINNKKLILIGYKDYLPFAWLLYDFQTDNFFSGKKNRIALNYIQGAQIEGVSFFTKDRVIISEERSKKRQKLYLLKMRDIK